MPGSVQQLPPPHFTPRTGGEEWRTGGGFQIATLAKGIRIVHIKWRIQVLYRGMCSLPHFPLLPSLPSRRHRVNAFFSSNRCAGEILIFTLISQKTLIMFSFLLLLESSVICVAMQGKFQYPTSKFICYFVCLQEFSYAIFWRWLKYFGQSYFLFLMVFFNQWRNSKLSRTMI